MICGFRQLAQPVSAEYQMPPRIPYKAGKYRPRIVYGNSLQVIFKGNNEKKKKAIFLEEKKIDLKSSSKLLIIYPSLPGSSSKSNWLVPNEMLWRFTFSLLS